MSFLPSLGAFRTASLSELVFLLLLLVAGIAIIMLVVKIVLFVLPAAVIAFVVWLLTDSLYWAGIAFLAVALISLIKR